MGFNYKINIFDGYKYVLAEFSAFLYSFEMTAMNLLKPTSRQGEWYKILLG